MSFVDFNISSEKKVDSINQDNVYEVTAYFCRGHYEDVLDEITNETVNTFIRDERFNEVTLIYVPSETTREEMLKELYQLLLEYKSKTDEVIPECVYL